MDSLKPCMFNGSKPAYIKTVGLQMSSVGISFCTWKIIMWEELGVTSNWSNEMRQNEKKKRKKIKKEEKKPDKYEQLWFKNTMG